MRFAWLRESSADPEPVVQRRTSPPSLIRFVYNAAFWVFLLPFFGLIDYSTGFVLFTIVIIVRMMINIYTNNIYKPTPEGYERFPFRIP